MLSAVNGNILQEVYYEKVGKVLKVGKVFDGGISAVCRDFCLFGRRNRTVYFGNAGGETGAERAGSGEDRSQIRDSTDFLPESKLSTKTKSLKSRSYRYDKAGRLVSVMCEACPELNESYLYDKQGNILEKRVGDKVYTFKYDTANQLASMESVEGLR